MGEDDTRQASVARIVMGERMDGAAARGGQRPSMRLVAPNDEPSLEGPKVAPLPMKPLVPDPAACSVTGVDVSGGSSRQVAESLDRSLHYFMSRFTFGISPIGLSEAYFDWLIHLCGSPGKQVQLWNEAVSNSVKLIHYLSDCACHERLGIAPCIAPLPNDKRFSAEDWQVFPFNFIHQAFLLNQHWWHTATTGVRGVSEHHARVMEFTMRQVLDVVHRQTTCTPILRS